MLKLPMRLKINGQEYIFDGQSAPTDMTLNTFIRKEAGIFGTKYMCLEGGCGACITVLKGIHPHTKEYQTWAVNSCLVLRNACDGLEVITIEGIGNKSDGYHPIQKRLAQLNGSQCGYCSSGMVMNMYALMESKSNNIKMAEIENAFGANLCRCTGYRPILDAMKTFATDFDHEYLDDIEDLNKICCGSNEKKCSKSCNRYISKEVISGGTDDNEWYSPNTLNEVFDYFGKIDENKKYILLAGATGHGVYRRAEDISVFIYLNKIAELRSFEVSSTKVVIGGSVTLTEAMEIFLKAAKIPGFDYCEKLYKHFDLIANVPVRNTGTLAGNLMLKHDHLEFPSDVFLTFEALNAKLAVISGPEEKFEMYTPTEFLKVNMNKKIIVNITLTPYPKENYIFDSYKIMPRAQNSHAYVNAAFLFQVNSGENASNIINARICFGGISPNFVHATITEKFVQGKLLYNITPTIADFLREELKPDWVLPDVSPQYRKLLACGLFYKFILSNITPSRIKEKYRSGGGILVRKISSGSQTFETIEKNFPLTKPVVKLEALKQCTGEAVYMNDLPYQPNEVWCCFVLATNVGSRIVEINTQDALSIPGVINFFSAKHIPGVNSFVMKNYFGLVENEFVFLPLDSVVQYFNQPVGIVVAKTKKIAEKASKYFKIIYENVAGNPVIRTTNDILNINPPIEESRLPLDHLAEFPELDDQFESSFEKRSNIFQGYLNLGSQYHFTMEPQTTVCLPIEDGMLIYSSSQWLTLTQAAVSKLLNVPQNSIQVQIKRIGGGFGSKISRSIQIACSSALACHILKRPVRFVQTIESMMGSLGKRHAFHCDYSGKLDSRGRISNLNISFLSDAGCSINESSVFITLAAWKNCYTFDEKNLNIKGEDAITDAPSNTWMRGPGTLEAMSMIETIMEHIARALNRDPVDVRLNHIANGNKLKTLLPDFLKNVQYKARKSEIENFNKKNRWIKKGIAFSIMQYPIFYIGIFPATLVVYHEDGSVGISHGGIEMGQGINTKAAQTAAYCLKIPLEKIRILASDTFNGANADVSGGSVASDSVCKAIKEACKVLNDRLDPIRQTMPSSSWEDLVKAANGKNINLIVNGAGSASNIEGYDVYGLACSEVEVDILTGNHILNRVDIFQDTGESINPLIDVGQIEGAFMMGVGYFTSEKLIYNSQTGQLITDRTWNYKIPGAKDIPVDFRINLLQKSPNATGVLRSKTTGEPAICLAISVNFALRMALESARKDAGVKETWFHLGAPITPEDIVLNSGTSVDMMKLL